MADQTIPDGFQALVREAMAEASHAMTEHPQPNYVISKFAEESGEVVKAAIHHAEGRESRDAVVAEMRQALAMMLRLWIEGDQVHGMAPLRGPSDADEEAPPGPNPIISPDQILAAARMMLDNHNALGSPGYNGALGLRALSAAIFAAEALRAADDYDAAPVALLRAFLTALIDPLHPDLDYLRADPKAAIEARASRHCDTCGRIQHAHNCGERDDG